MCVCVRAYRMSQTALDNEFFTNALSEWRDRLMDGEFTQENQQRLKREDDKPKVDPWKVIHCHPLYVY